MTPEQERLTDSITDLRDRVTRLEVGVLHLGEKFDNGGIEFARLISDMKATIAELRKTLDGVVQEEARQLQAEARQAGSRDMLRELLTYGLGGTGVFSIIGGALYFLIRWLVSLTTSHHGLDINLYQ